MLASVLQLVSSISILCTVTIVPLLGIYRHYILMIFGATIALIANSMMILCSRGIKRCLPTTPFALKLQRSQTDEILQALEAKPVIPDAYYNFRKIGRMNIRLLVLVHDGVEMKVLKKRANAAINKLTKYREEQPLFEVFKMIRLNLTIEKNSGQRSSVTAQDVMYCSHGRAEMVLNMVIFPRDHQLLIPRLQKDAELHEIRRYQAAIRMMKNALSIER